MCSIALGSDPNASDLKLIIKKHLEDLDFICNDFGSEDIIYANVAFRVAEAVANKEYSCGILICGTGIGMCISANKVKGVYAANCSDVYSAERAKKSNNTNILTLGSQILGYELAKKIVTVWMESKFTLGCRSEPKIQRIYDYE